MFLNKLTAFFQPAVDRLSKLTIFQTRMDLLQCVTPTLPARKSPSRQVRSEEREIRRQANGASRRISLPAGNYAVSHSKWLKKFLVECFKILRTYRVLWPPF